MRLRVFEAADANNACEVLDSRATVDIVFSDVRMPGQMDGFALALWIRQNRPVVRVILTSGYTETGQRAAELSDSFQAKPYRLEEVQRHIDSILQSTLMRAGVEGAPSLHLQADERDVL
jgi:CheY-like chemotaxis protein